MNLKDELKNAQTEEIEFQKIQAAKYEEKLKAIANYIISYGIIDTYNDALKIYRNIKDEMRDLEFIISEIEYSISKLEIIDFTLEKLEDQDEK